jgi:hypothetical protein
MSAYEEKAANQAGYDMGRMFVDSPEVEMEACDSDEGIVEGSEMEVPEDKEGGAIGAEHGGARDYKRSQPEELVAVNRVHPFGLQFEYENAQRE